MDEEKARPVKACGAGEKAADGQAKGHGPTSYHALNPERIFSELGLLAGHVFLDLGCGVGDYAVDAAGRVGDGGIVFALEKSERLVADLKNKASRMGLGMIRPVAADITRPLPLNDASVDVCLICTVLHIPGVSERMEKIFREVFRVLKPGARVVIVECHKEEMSLGPPLYMRLAPGEIEAVAARCALKKAGYVDLGFLYSIKYAKDSPA